MPASSGKTNQSFAELLRKILATCNLSLADVSRASLAPDNRLAHIPHSFYSSLRNGSFSPSLYQLHSLSRLSGYRLIDWLAFFRISLDDASRFQIAFPSVRTVELDAAVYQADRSVPWLYDVKQPDFRTPLAPLSQWVTVGLPRRIGSPSRGGRRRFRYLKIGSHDALAFPDLLPGSIVRVAENSSLLERASVGKSLGRTLFVVRRNIGITCARLFRSEPDKIVLCSRQLPYAPIELTVGAEGIVLGTVDLEFRSLAGVAKPVVSARFERYRTPGLLGRSGPARNAGDFIRRARESCGISFREASARTRIIARELGDRRYYCSPGALSDYETRKLAPRHIHKLISIAAVYFARIADLFEACGAALDNAGSRAMPGEFLNAPPSRNSPGKPSRFLREMERRFGPLPWFLRSAGSSLFGLPNISLRDVFWVGDSPEPKHSCMAGIQLLIVDRRQKRPRASLSCPIWAQPIYVLQKRGGSYLWGFCRLENGVLALYSPVQRSKATRLRNREEAEVVGRVVGIVRTIP
jgi:transcriptional regulator with XRE-family HTH domain